MYDGQWSEDQANGFGVRVNQNGVTYEGSWKNDLYHGAGVLSWTGEHRLAGCKYTGDFVRGKAHGKGRMEWKIGATFEGDWADGKRHGKGR